MRKIVSAYKRFKWAGVVVGATLLVGGVAFALLQSQATLSGNSIQTGTTGLVISPNDTNYGPSTTGFAFGGIIPGAQASETEHFLLKNSGSTPLALKIAAARPPANPQNIDLNKVSVILTPYSLTTFMPSTPQSFSLQSLVDASADGGLPVIYPDKLATASKEEFNIQVAMDADAVSGSSATLSSLDLVFTGVATN